MIHLNMTCFSQEHDLECIKILIAIGANVNATDQQGRAPLDLLGDDISGTESSDGTSRSLELVSTLPLRLLEQRHSSIFENSTRRAPSNEIIELLKAAGGLWFHNTSHVRETQLLSSEELEGVPLAMQPNEVEKFKRAGSRILCLDGGGIRGLIQLEVLSQLERKTGKRITELFDWIIGTSTGGIIALGLVYGVYIPLFNGTILVVH